MDAIQTIPAKILEQMRGEIDADSSVFDRRLKPESELDRPAPFSSLFAAACLPRDSESCAEAAGKQDANLYQLGLEYIFEGYLLHYGRSRLLAEDGGEFPVLAGDHMYARGLAAIASLGDLHCIMALAELIRVCSLIECEGLAMELAVDAWAVTTLELAKRASGTVPPEAPGGSAGGPERNSEATLVEPAGLGGRLEALLAAYPEGRRENLRGLISELGSNFVSIDKDRRRNNGAR